MSVALSTLEVGKTYRVVYQNPGERLPREMVVDFMGKHANGTTSWWSLRPVAGTQELPTDWIREVYLTDRPKSAPRIYRGETRVY